MQPTSLAGRAALPAIKCFSGGPSDRATQPGGYLSIVVRGYIATGFQDLKRTGSPVLVALSGQNSGSCSGVSAQNAVQTMQQSVLQSWQAPCSCFSYDDLEALGLQLCSHRCPSNSCQGKDECSLPSITICTRRMSQLSFRVLHTVNSLAGVCPLPANHMCCGGQHVWRCTRQMRGKI
jgi:hypothetical protein